MNNVPYIGEILSLSAAIFWAVGVILFKRSGESMSPMALNLFKNGIGLMLLIPTAFLLGTNFYPDVPLNYWILVSVSGVIGISIADTMFFVSLNRLGAGLTAVVDTTYTPIILTMSFFFLDERIDAHNLFGAALIMGALLLGTATKPEKGKTRRDIIIGSIVGITGIALMGLGLIMIKHILNEVDLIWTTVVRLAGGFGGILILSVLHPQRRKIIRSLKPSPSWRFAFPAAFFGTFIALTAWLGGMKYIAVSRSALLNQLSTIFIFILAAIFLKEPVTARRLIAILMAFSGAVLVII